MLARPIRCEPFEKEVQKSLAEFRWAPVPSQLYFKALSAHVELVSPRFLTCST